MAISFVGQRGVHNASGWGGTEFIDLPTGGSISVANTLIMMIAIDNSASGGTMTEISVTDAQSNVWTRLSRTLNDPGIEDQGVQLEVWTSFVQDLYVNGNDIELTLSEPVTRGCVFIIEFAGIKPLNYSVVTPMTATGNSTSAGPGNITPSASGQLVIAMAGVETNATMAGDGDSTGGSWSTFLQVISDSGSAASSVSLAYQYKIVSSTTTQDWDTTWSGSADWCALAIVMDIFVPTSDPTVNGNPDYPCISGFEGLPIDSALVPVDTGTQYLFQHQMYPNADDIGDYSCGVEFEVPLVESQHHVIFELFPGTADQMNTNDEIVIYRFPVKSGSTDGTITGGATFVDALNSPGGNQVVLDDGQRANITFETPATPLIGKRIVRIGIRYIAWKDDSSPSTPSEGVDVSWVDNQYTPFVVESTADMGAWLTLEYRSNSRYVTRWLGEVNYLPVGGYDPLDNNRPSVPFSSADLFRMGASGNCYIKMVALRGDDIDAPATDTIWLDYAELIIETTVERRIGAAVRSAGTAITASVVSLAGVNVGSFGREDGVILKNPIVPGGSAVIPASVPLVLGIREALPATPSDYYRNLTSNHLISQAEAFGPSLLIKGALVPRDTLEPRPDVYRASVSGGVLAADPVELDQYILSVIGFPQSSYLVYGSFWPGYSTFEERRSTIGLNTFQYILVNGSTQFDRIKVVVKPDPTVTQSLTISIEKPLATVLATATITVATALAGLPLGNGYYEISVPLSAVITPSAGQVAIRLATASVYPAAWSVPRVVPYGGEAAFGYNPANPETFVRDYAIVLQCAISNPSITIASVTVTVARSSCGNSASLTHPQIQISPTNTLDRYVIYRSTTVGHADVISVAILDADTAPVDSGPSYTWDDYGVPWDVTSVYYQVIGYRDADRRTFTSSWTAWSGAPSASPGPAFGLSDQSTGTVVAFDPIDPSDMNLAWKPLNPIEQVQLHGIDYSIALRAPEERGLSVTVPILIDNMYTCASTPVTNYAEPIVPGNKAMTPSPYDVLRLLERSSRLCLQLPGGHVRWVSLDLGNMTIRVAGAVYVAEITLTDVVRPSSDPYNLNPGDVG